MSVEDDFVSEVERMLSNADYLFPYIWSQRLFRQDNYQMASQALLEDMFFDTMGDYLNRGGSRHEWHRRTGAEPWDYRFDLHGFSHKEGLSPVITTVWQAGDGPGNKIPKWSHASFAEPVVFSYTPTNVKMAIEGTYRNRKGVNATFSRLLRPLSHVSARYASSPNAYIFFGQIDRAAGEVSVEQVWSGTQWLAMDMRDMQRVAQGRLLTSDFWLMTITSEMAKRGFDPPTLACPVRLRLVSEDLPSALYVLTPEKLSLPLTANNKAHFIAGSALESVMRAALEDGRAVPLPLWPAIYADTTPPNLYHDLKSRYDARFQARLPSP